MLFQHRDPAAAYGFGQRALDLRAGGVAARMDHPERAVPALAGPRQRAVGTRVELGTGRAQPRDRRGTVREDVPHGCARAQADACRQRVLDVLAQAVARIELVGPDHCDTALRPAGVARRNGVLADHQDPQAQLPGPQRRRQARDTGADDE